MLLKRAFAPNLGEKKKNLPDLRDFRISELCKVIMDGNRHFIDEGT